MTTDFSAAASALGYLYQCRVALLGALKRIKSSPDLVVKIECLDDVSFEASGTPAELLQTKHSVTKGSLTDSSAELWKTLRVWCETPSIRDGQGPLFLISTARAPAGSIAEKLGFGNARDYVAAELALSDIAQKDVKTLRAAHEAFGGLELNQRLSLLERVVVLDDQPTVVDLEEQIHQEVRFAAPSTQLPALVERLEGWWWKRCLQHLTAPKEHELTGESLLTKIGELRDQLREDNLPIDELYASVDASSLDAQQYVFVRQLEFIDVLSPRISFAVRDYLRAFAQKSRWQRDGLLKVGELEKYERRLTEAWELRFATMAEELGDAAAEEAKVAAARVLYEWAEQECTEWIRPACSEPFVVRGSFHQLSDRQAIGWHLDFESRLASLLDPAPSATP